MPLIRIENHSNPHGFPNIQIVAEALRAAFVKAGVPGINSVKEVTVVLGGEQIIDTDKHLVIVVEGLLDLPERTKEVRDRLAQVLAECAIAMLPRGWSVEVLVYRFDRTRDSFYSRS